MSAHPTDDLAAYAIGALDPGDRSRVEDHLAGCTSCRAEVGSFDDVAWGIAGLVNTDPPPELRGLVIGRAAREATRSGPRGAMWRAFGFRVPVAIPLALAVLLALTLAGLGSARGDADAYARAVAGVVDAKVVTLVPASASDPAGSLVVPTSGEPYLILRLPAPPAGKTWEAWVLRDGQPSAAGITGSRSGIVTLALTRPVRSGDELALTLEDAGGVSAPRGAIVLRGRL